MTTNFQRTANWLAACGKQPGDKATIGVQAGCHLEEFAEQLDCMVLVSNTGLASAALQEISDVLKGVANTLKHGHATVEIHDHEELLDGLCDAEVTGNGLAYFLGYDKDGADQAVLFANDDKLNPDGTPVIKPGGKIGKREGWMPPDMAPFIPHVIGEVDAQVGQQG